MMTACDQSMYTAFMQEMCPAACGLCKAPSAEPCTPVRDAVGPGDIRRTFDRVLARKDFRASVLSEDPYILVLDHFASEQDAATWAEAALAVGGFGLSGSSCGHKGVCNSSSMSCLPVAGARCWEHEAMRQLESRMVDVVGVPAENCEPLRFVHYSAGGQRFGPHHDAVGQGGIDPHTPGGPRSWTLYTFLTRVEAGGALRFPALNLSIEARPGRAVLWPHLLDDDLQSVDERTVHEGAPVFDGIKVGVNLHAHRNNLRTRILAGCTGPGGDSAGGDGGGTKLSHVFHYESTPGATPLHDMVGFQSVGGARRLIDTGAPVDAPDRAGTTPLHIAAGRGLVEIMDALVARGAQADQADRDGATPLHEASLQGQAEAARFLLRTGADPNPVGAGGTSALHLAARHGHREVTYELLHAGASPHLADERGLTPLHLAVRYGRTEVARGLLDAGATTKAVDKNGATPLHSAVGAISNDGEEAAAEAAAEGVRVLLQAGAPPTVVGSRGMTPLHIAAGLGRIDALQLLLHRGADFTVKDQTGATPLTLARRMRKEECADALERAERESERGHPPHTPVSSESRSSPPKRTQARDEL